MRHVIRLITFGIVLAFGCSTDPEKAASTIASDDGKAGETPEAPSPPAVGKNDGFQQAGMPTPVTGAYLTAYRDPPSAVTAASEYTLVYAVVRDASGKPLPRTIPITTAVARFDDGTSVAGVRDTTPGSDYHVRFRIPKAQLANVSIGRDRVIGDIEVRTPAVQGEAVATSIVIWVANVGLVADRTDLGTVVIPPAGAPPAVIRLAVSVSGGEQPAQGATLRGLGGELAVVGGSCPPLDEARPADLTADCDLHLAPTRIAVLDRVLTLSYYNGVRTDSASIVLRGESAVILGQPDGTSLGAQDAPRRAITDPMHVIVRKDTLVVADEGGRKVLVWNELPQRSFAPADVVLATGVGFPSSVESDGRNLVVAEWAPPRVRVWNTMPAADDTPPDAVLTQHAPQRAFSLTWDGTRLLATSSVSAARWWTGLPETPPTLLHGEVYYEPEMLTYEPPGQPWTYRAVGPMSYDGTRYIEALPDRIRIFDKWPIDHDKPSVVLGATDAAKHTYLSLAQRRKALSDGRRLFATEVGRVLVWRSIPKANGVPPDFAVGQRDLASSLPNAFGASPDSLHQPSSIAVHGDTLIIADAFNHRIIMRPVPGPRPELTLPERPPLYDEGEAAPGILTFQESFHQLGNVALGSMADRLVVLRYSGSTPVRIDALQIAGEGLAFAGGAAPGVGGTCGRMLKDSCLLRLTVTPARQGQIHATIRVVYDNGIETRATQLTFVGAARRFAKRQQALPPGRERMDLAPGGPGLLVSLNDGRDFLAMDAVLFRPSAPEAPVATLNPCYVDSNFDTAFAAQGRLYVVCHANLPQVWRSIPAADVPRDYVLPTPLVTPPVAAGGALYGARSWLYGWLQPPDASGAQPSFTLKPEDVPGSKLFQQVFLLDGKLVALDVDSAGRRGRLLVWNSPPRAATPPDAVVDLPTSAFRGDPHYAMKGWHAWASDGVHLYYADTDRHRIVAWRGIPRSGQEPDLVLGQLTVDGAVPNDGGIGPWSFRSPTHMFVQDGEIYVRDSGNGRVLVFDAP